MDVQVETVKGMFKATVREGSKVLSRATAQDQEQAVAYALSVAGFYDDKRVTDYAEKDDNLFVALRRARAKAARARLHNAAVKARAATAARRAKANGE